MSEANVAAWAVVGAALGAYDGYKYAQKKDYTGWKKAAAIVGGAVLGAVNPFKVVKVAKTAAKVVTVSKYTKAATSAKKATTAAKKVTSKPKQTVVTKKSTQTATKTSTAKKTTQAAKTEQKTVKAACFTAGTKIDTEKGFKNIEAIKVGDYVWSENPETKEKALKKVKKIFVREKDSIIRLAINGEAIETTDEHPFYVEGRGFTEAKWLKAGDEVRLATGNAAEVDTIESVQLDSPVKVYNFEVEDFHTYYVSEPKVLVHNTCGGVNNNSQVAKITSTSNTVRVKDSATDNTKKPYANSRPSFRKGVAEQVWENAKDKYGVVRDPNTGDVIEWTPGTSRRGVWDMGHIPSEKYAEVHAKYMRGEMSKAEFVDWYNNPKNYRPELPRNNRSHRFE